MTSRPRDPGRRRDGPKMVDSFKYQMFLVDADGRSTPMWVLHDFECRDWVASSG